MPLLFPPVPKPEARYMLCESCRIPLAQIVEVQISSAAKRLGWEPAYAAHPRVTINHCPFQAAADDLSRSRTETARAPRKLRLADCDASTCL